MGVGVRVGVGARAGVRVSSAQAGRPHLPRPSYVLLGRRVLEAELDGARAAVDGRLKLTKHVGPCPRKGVVGHLVRVGDGVRVALGVRG